MKRDDLTAGSVIRDVTIEDAPSICVIYNHYVQHTHVTFEETPVEVAEMAGRISATTSIGLPWLVYEEDTRVLGYAYASPWKSRSAYRYSLESTVYVKARETLKGVGTALYGALLDRLLALDIHAVTAGIALPNPVSIALHRKMGFEKVAHFKQVGFKFERWIDVAYWEWLRESGRSGSSDE